MVIRGMGDTEMLKHAQFIALGAGLFITSACAAAQVPQDPVPLDAKPGVILDADEGSRIDFPLHPTTRLASADQTASGLSLFEISIVAQTAGAPPHRHQHEDEFFYVRDGRITFMVDGVQKTISAGGFVLLPRGGWHAMWNNGDTDAILLVGTSEGEFDDFFDAVAIEVSSAGDLSPPEIGAIVGKVGAERGIAIDMTKVPDSVRHLYGMPPAN